MRHRWTVGACALGRKCEGDGRRDQRSAPERGGSGKFRLEGTGVRSVWRGGWVLGWILALCWGVGTLRPVSAQVLLEGDPIPRLTVTSQPSGALVRLLGEYEWTGTTPWNLSRPVVGLYQVEASLPGYETWRGEVILGVDGLQDLQIRLSSKNRFKAAFRSIVFPGWGQHYAGAQKKGTLFTLGVLTGGVTAFFLHEEYRDDVDAFDDAALAYQSAQNVDELPALRRELAARGRDADRSYDRYRVALTVTGGVYALSIVDALLFFPDTRVLGSVERAAVTNPTDETDEGERLAWSLDLDPGVSHSRVGLRVRW